MALSSCEAFVTRRVTSRQLMLGERHLPASDLEPGPSSALGTLPSTVPATPSSCGAQVPCCTGRGSAQASSASPASTNPQPGTYSLGFKSHLSSSEAFPGAPLLHELLWPSACHRLCQDTQADCRLRVQLSLAVVVSL